MASSFPSRAHLRNLETIARKTTTQTSQHADRRPFSVCARCQSKIGRKVISIPPEVTFQIMPPVQSKKRRIVVSSTILAEQQKSQMSTVNIKGPLGMVRSIVQPNIYSQIFTDAYLQYRRTQLPRPTVCHVEPTRRRGRSCRRHNSRPRDQTPKRNVGNGSGRPRQPRTRSQRRSHGNLTACRRRLSSLNRNDRNDEFAHI